MYSVGKQGVSLWFQPITPAECADTPKASLLDWSLVQSIVPPLSLPTLVSDLPEEPWSDFASSSAKYQSFAYMSWKCRRQGVEAEQQLLDLARKQGWTPKKVKNHAAMDRYGHVDFMFKLPNQTNPNEEVWIDVKSSRALRSGWDAQSEYMTVELHETGWLMGGKATVIAQQIQPHKFILLDRVALARYVKSVVETDKPLVPYNEQSVCRAYIRETTGKRGQVVTSVLSLIPTLDAYRAAGCGVLDTQDCSSPHAT